MMNRFIHLPILIAVVAGLVSAGLPDGVAAQPMKELRYQGTPYISGGIGSVERERLEEMAVLHNVKLIFAVETGHYLSAVDVVIQNSGGTVVVEDVSHGPWFYTTLAPGDYTITAKAKGESRMKEAKVGGGWQSKVHFRWPDEESE